MNDKELGKVIRIFCERYKRVDVKPIMALFENYTALNLFGKILDDQGKMPKRSEKKKKCELRVRGYGSILLQKEIEKLDNRFAVKHYYNILSGFSFSSDSGVDIRIDIVYDGNKDIVFKVKVNAGQNVFNGNITNIVWEETITNKGVGKHLHAKEFFWDYLKGLIIKASEFHKSTAEYCLKEALGSIKKLHLINRSNIHFS